MKLSFSTLTLSLIATSLCYSMTPDEQLYFAIQFGNLHKAQSAIQNNANINNPDNCSYVPLHHAAYYGHIEIVKLLLMHGAHNSINAQSCTGSTPLYYAVYRNHIEIVKLLVDAGANITLKNKDHETALDLARREKKQEISQLLEEYLLLQKEVQETPTRETLHKAIKGNYQNLVIQVLKKGIIADISDLHLAKELSHKEIERMLITYLLI